MQDKPFQRKGAISNAHVGRDFERLVQEYFASTGLHLKKSLMLPIGFHGRKYHCFDLGDYKDQVLVECKAHTWTEGGNIPSAKLTTWDQAMYYFHVAPRGFRRILVVLKDFSPKRKETLGQHYVRTNWHLIPKSVEIWEYDMELQTAYRINIQESEAGRRD